jgi:signal transduction histidine kinase
MNSSHDDHHRVLVVDDEPQIIAAIDDLLEGEFQVLGTTDPEEALGLLQREEVEVIISDQRMPRMSGDQFLSQARELCPAVRVLITGYSDPQVLVRAVNHGQIHAYVNKPWDPLELRLLVLRCAEQYHLSQALQQSEARLRTLIEHLPEGVCLLDEAGQLVLANPAGREYLQALGAERAQVRHLAGQPLAAFLTPRADGLAHEVEVSSRVFGVETRPLQQGEVVLVLRERTQEREVLKRVQQQERLASVGQLAAGIAHDFNNLLTVITGFSQTLERRAGLDDEVRKDLGTITTYGDRAAQMIRQILDFSRSQPVEQAPMELGAFVKEGMKTLRQVLPEHLWVQVQVQGTHPVLASVSQLHQVLTNLVVNARDAMPQGGELQVGLASLEVAPGQPPPLQWMGPGAWVVWTVSDTGMGIPPEALKRIYEPFFTTKQEQGGTGLGLAQVYGIVKQHRGYIDVQSRVGAGTTFVIYLPRLAQGQKEAAGAAVAAETGGQGETILLVEDQAAVLNVVRLLLEGLNYRVLVAGNGQEALELYRQQREQIALVLTDWMMPKMGGGELIAALQELDPEVRVVVISGYAQKKEAHLQNLEIAGWLDKPVKMDSLMQVVREALRRRA